MKAEKIRIVCSNCLASKVIDKHSTDPKKTRFILTVMCPKCDGEGSGLKYFDDNMQEIIKTGNV